MLLFFSLLNIRHYFKDLDWELIASEEMLQYSLLYFGLLSRLKIGVLCFEMGKATAWVCDFTCLNYVALVQEFSKLYLCFLKGLRGHHLLPGLVHLHLPVIFLYKFFCIGPQKGSRLGGPSLMHKVDSEADWCIHHLQKKSLCRRYYF